MRLQAKANPTPVNTNQRRRTDGSRSCQPFQKHCFVRCSSAEITILLLTCIRTRQRCLRLHSFTFLPARSPVSWFLVEKPPPSGCRPRPQRRGIRIAGRQQRFMSRPVRAGHFVADRPRSLPRSRGATDASGERCPLMDFWYGDRQSSAKLRWRGQAGSESRCACCRTSARNRSCKRYWLVRGAHPTALGTVGRFHKHVSDPWA